MCSCRLGAAAASILSQNLERQAFFREAERKKETESGKDNEKVRKIKREWERYRECEKGKEKVRKIKREWGR